MIQAKMGTVTKILVDGDEIQELEIRTGGKIEKALNYPDMTGKVQIGNEVVLNTTAVELSLGTGGYHFVLHGPQVPDAKPQKDRHIMKLRYTPMQIATGACEEEGSPYHDIFLKKDSIEGMPVIVGELHSMLPILAGYLKFSLKGCRIAYIMTDKGALPMAFSKHVKALKDIRWLDGTITTGHAFGGDLECLTIYTALLAAKHIIGADITIVIMGPGIVGTGTPLGFTGIEQVEVLHAVYSMRGIPILTPRIGTRDRRQRHQGMSHHTYTVLQHTLVPVHVPLLEEVREWKLESSRHFLHYKKKQNLKDIKEILSPYSMNVETMGRGIEEDPLFFYAVAGAADFAGTILKNSNALSGEADLGQSWRDSTIL